MKIFAAIAALIFAAIDLAQAAPTLANAYFPPTFANKPYGIRGGTYPVPRLRYSPPRSMINGHQQQSNGIGFGSSAVTLSNFDTDLAADLDSFGSKHRGRNPSEPDAIGYSNEIAESGTDGNVPDVTNTRATEFEEADFFDDLF